MNRFAVACAATLAFLLPAIPAQADMTLGQFRNYVSMPGGDSLVRSYLGGLRDGLMMYQAVLKEQQGVAATFCPDGNELKQGTRFEDILFAEISEPSTGEPWPGDIQMARLATLALQAEFPCESY